MRPGQRKVVFLAALAGLLALYLWGLVGLPGFGHYPGPYGDVLNAVAVAQRHATDVVTAINFDYRGFDTVGEEFILFTAATGVSVVLRQARRERERPAVDEARDRDAPQTSDAVRLACLLFIGPTALVGWEVVTHGQVSPGGGFQGGVVLATAFLLVYLGGQYLSLRRISPVDVTDAVEAIGAGGFVVIGLSALFVGLPYLANDLPLGMSAGTVDSSGTIALISFFVGVEVTRGVRAHRRRAVGADPDHPDRNMTVFPFVVVAWILGVGLYGMVTSRHLVHQIVCLAVVQSSTYVLLLGVGYRRGAAAPYFSDIAAAHPCGRSGGGGVDPDRRGGGSGRHRTAPRCRGAGPQALRDPGPRAAA